MLLYNHIIHNVIGEILSRFIITIQLTVKLPAPDHLETVNRVKNMQFFWSRTIIKSNTVLYETFRKIPEACWFESFFGQIFRGLGFGVSMYIIINQSYDLQLYNNRQQLVSTLKFWEKLWTNLIQLIEKLFKLKANFKSINFDDWIWKLMWTINTRRIMLTILIKLNPHDNPYVLPITRIIDRLYQHSQAYNGDPIKTINLSKLGPVCHPYMPL